MSGGDREETRPRGKPEWIRLARAEGPAFAAVRRTLRSLELGTVCEEARCPNRAECWSAGTATFLLMGRQCTRSCRFCSVRPGRGGEPLDPGEPGRVAEAVEALGLRFAVLTSVSRDDLPDGGAAHYAETIRAIRRRSGGVGVAVRVEVLVPDYLGEPLRAVLDAEPDVFAHNVEVVRELTGAVRDRRCSYERSLDVLATARRLRPGAVIKSSLLLGLGETDAQVEAALDDLRAAGVDAVCLGQYLQPTKKNLEVQRWVPPERFAELEALARAKGFARVVSGPLVRTSYHAERVAGWTGSTDAVRGRPLPDPPLGGEGARDGESSRDDPLPFEGRAGRGRTQAVSVLPGVAPGPPPRAGTPEACSLKPVASPLSVLRPGRVPYEEALALQEDLARRRRAREISDTVVVLEHPPVITLGHRGDAQNVVASPERLRDLGITVHRVSRGGDVTYHGPGQVVVYPVVDLDEARLGTARFVEMLEECMIRTAARFGVAATRVAGKRGVFAGHDELDKIGAVGIHVSRGVTTHGLALNVDPDLGHYDLIVACGLREHGVTSLRRAAGRPVDQREVEDALVAHLADLLGRTVEAAP